MNANFEEIEFEDKRLREMLESLRSQLARVTTELAARTEERDAALELGGQLDDQFGRLYAWAKRTVRADLHSPLEIIGEYESLRDERDGLAAQLKEALAFADEWLHGERDHNRVFLAVAHVLFRGEKKRTAILAARDARVRAEAIRESTECWPGAPIPTTTGKVRAALLKLADRMAAAPAGGEMAVPIEVHDAAVTSGREVLAALCAVASILGHDRPPGETWRQVGEELVRDIRALQQRGGGKDETHG